MRTMSNTFMMTLAGAAALLAASCSSSKTGGGDGGGGGIPLIPNETGFVSEPMSHILGPWYSYGDSAGPGANLSGTDPDHSDCVAGALTAIPPGTGGFTVDQCTQIITPIPGQPFAPDANLAMCTSGIGAKVIYSPGTTTEDYSDLFGGGIGLDLNNPGGDAGVKGDIDLSQYTGFSFTFSAFPGAPAGSPTDIPAGNKIRVNFPFTGEHGTDSPYWAANKVDDHSPIDATGAVNVIHWADIQGPAYLATRSPPVPAPPFFPGPGAGVNKIQSIQWQVFTNTGTTTPYGFCVSNLTLLTN